MSNQEKNWLRLQVGHNALCVCVCILCSVFMKVCVCMCIERGIRLNSCGWRSWARFGSSSSHLHQKKNSEVNFQSAVSSSAQEAPEYLNVACCSSSGNKSFLISQQTCQLTTDPSLCLKISLIKTALCCFISSFKCQSTVKCFSDSLRFTWTAVD